MLLHVNIIKQYENVIFVSFSNLSEHSEIPADSLSAREQESPSKYKSGFPLRDGSNFLAILLKNFSLEIQFLEIRKWGPNSGHSFSTSPRQLLIVYDYDFQ